jgi:hypothetical protein
MGFRLKQAVRGYSWTLNRNVACWFAIRFAEENGSALVLTAEVPRKQIMFHSDERSEAEVVCFDIPTLTIDGDLNAGNGVLSFMR